MTCVACLMSAAGVGALRPTLEPLWRVPAYEKDLEFFLGVLCLGVLAVRLGLGASGGVHTRRQTRAAAGLLAVVVECRYGWGAAALVLVHMAPPVHVHLHCCRTCRQGLR